MNMQKMMQEAQKIQKNIENTKKELELKEYTGESSFVKVKVNGKKELLSLKINEEIKLDDIEILEDMIVVAINEAIKKAEQDKSNKMSKYGSSLSGLF